MFFVKAISVWFVILIIAIFNGMLREKILIGYISRKYAFIISGFMLCFFIFLITWLFFPWFGIFSQLTSLEVGLIWLIATIVFEFSFGFWVQKRPLTELLEAYTFKSGNIWTIVLMILFLSPLIVFHIME